MSNLYWGVPIKYLYSTKLAYYSETLLTSRGDWNFGPYPSVQLSKLARSWLFQGPIDLLNERTQKKQINNNISHHYKLKLNKKGK